MNIYWSCKRCIRTGSSAPSGLMMTMKDHRKPHIRADPLEETRRWGYSIVINYNLRLLVLSSKQIYTNTSIPPFLWNRQQWTLYRSVLWCYHRRFTIRVTSNLRLRLGIAEAVWNATHTIARNLLLLHHDEIKEGRGESRRYYSWWNINIINHHDWLFWNLWKRLWKDSFFHLSLSPKNNLR